MKTNKITLLLIIVFSLLAIKVQGQQININNANITEINSKIIGTWISEEDSNWKIIFNSQGICYWSYNNVITETFSYSISTTSPQCDYNVRTNTSEDFYLKIINQGDNNEQLCYEILGVDNESLSLSSIGIGVKYFYFLKQ